MKKLILSYLRNFPIEIGKKRLSSFVALSDNEKEFVFTNKNDLKFNLDTKEYVMKQIFLYGIYEKLYVEFLSKFSQNEIKTIVDIGANIGNYTLSLKQAYPNCKVHSFEPNSINYSRLISNINLNGFNNIKTNQIGLADKKGELKLYFDDKNMGAATLAENVGSKSETILLETLDNYCVENKISNIDLLKIDIEGGELNCLKGGVNILKKTQKGILQLEIDYGHCKRVGYTSKDLFEFPIKFGYNPFLLNKWGKIKPIKNLPDNFIGNVIYLKGY